MNTHSRQDALYSQANLMGGQNSFTNGEKYEPFQAQVQSSIKKEMKSSNLGNVSKTLRSTLLPHSFNLTPGKIDMQSPAN